MVGDSMKLHKVLIKDPKLDTKTAFYMNQYGYELFVDNKNLSEKELIQISDVVVDVKNNTYIKCRYYLEDLMDKLLEDIE
jgi:deoxyhypusine synthase